MALGPRLDLRQTQSLVMTPQLQQAIKLLTLSNLEIESFIGEALETNPLLEAGEVSREASGDGPESGEGDAPDPPTADQLITRGEGESDAPLDLDPTALDRDRDTGDGELQREPARDWGAAGATGAGGGAGAGEDRPDIGESAAQGPTLAQHLEAQLGAVALDPRTSFAARHIIGLLDEAGYLQFSLRDVAGDLGISILDVEHALALVQSLDPTGVGARDLGECLALQAREANRYDPAMARLLENLDLVARGELPRLRRMCAVDEEDLRDMLAELRSYDPKPGLAFGGGPASAIVPDVLIAKGRDGGWDISLNQDSLPRLVVNREYYLEMRDGAPDKEAQSWLKERLADANWLIKALDQRQKTILKTAAEIVKRQEGFFTEGVAALKPLTLREVAEEIDMHESTVSRVTSNKYLHCDRGCFELKYFFSSGVGSSDGEGASAQAVKERIKALVEGEDPKKILSDDKLVALLKAEGFDIARRTVAKYREAAGIGSSVERRRQKKLQGL